MKRIGILICWGVVLTGFCATSVADEESANLSLLIEVIGQSDAVVQESLLQGIVKGMEGRRNVTAPDSWSEVSKKLLKSESRKVRILSEELAQIFGDKEAAARAFKTVQDPSAPTADRKRALWALVTQKDDRLQSEIPKLLSDDELRRDAIRAFGAFESKDAAKILLDRFGKFAAEDKRAVVEVLATRKSYAMALVGGLKSDQLSREDIPAHVARALKDLLGKSFTDVYGPIRELTKDRQKVMAKYKRRLSPEALAQADASAGRAVFQKTCASCHLMYGVGGKIGPDLTGSNRANLDYLMLNSIDPSYDVPDGYRMVVIQTDDGRVLSGVIAEVNDRRVILKTVDQPQVVILKDDIENRRVSPKSIMPDGQLDQLKNQEVLNLVKYMQTKQQVELPQ